MATINPVLTKPGEFLVMVTWNDITQGDTVTGANIASYPDQTVIIDGSFGGATVFLEGAISTTTGGGGRWLTLTDAFNNAISATTTTIKNVLQTPVWVRPRLDAGSASSITVYLIGKG